MRIPLLAKVLLVGAASLGAATAAKAEHQVIDNVAVTEEEGCAAVEVSFNFPVRYVKHFPYDSGDDLRIQLEPIVTRGQVEDSLGSRETVLPPTEDAATLTKVVYEGNIDGGPFLTLLFSSQMRFSVAQGQDYRKVVVSVFEEGAQCPPPLKK